MLKYSDKCHLGDPIYTVKTIGKRKINLAGSKVYSRWTNVNLALDLLKIYKLKRAF